MRKKKQKLSPNDSSGQKATRMLARCEKCRADYIPRGRGDSEISDLKLFYIPHDSLEQDKQSLVCPMHNGNSEPAGLILSEDCLDRKYGSAMGMIAFSFSDDEVSI